MCLATLVFWQSRQIAWRRAPWCWRKAEGQKAGAPRAIRFQHHVKGRGPRPIAPPNNAHRRQKRLIQTSSKVLIAKGKRQVRPLDETPQPPVPQHACDPLTFWPLSFQAPELLIPRISLQNTCSIIHHTQIRYNQIWPNLLNSNLIHKRLSTTILCVKY